MVKKQEKLRRILTEREITPYKLAKGSGIYPNDIYSILSGEKKIFPKWRKSISEYLELPEDEIFED